MIEQTLENAKKACRNMQVVDKDTKIKALHAMADALVENTDYILEENQKDIASAKDNGITDAMVDRLLLTADRIEAMAQGVRDVAGLNDPIGDVIREIERPNGLMIRQIRIPIGTVAVIYESRPNVTVDIAAICVKTNNVCILKGGKEAIHSNVALAKVMNDAIQDLLPENVINMIDKTDRSIVTEILTDTAHVDVVIPRGGKGLIQHVVNNAKVPVIETGAGLCHLYVDKEADIDMALEIAVNAKTQRPSVCNAIETLLVHKDVAADFLARLQPLIANVEIFGDETALQYMKGSLATTQNYGTEYDDYKLNVKVVENVDEAIEHIYTYSTKHSESIVTKDVKTAHYFMNALDSACVYHNASTRFTDGGEFGFGAEVGISTQKLHARGPIGLQEMTSTKYEIYGDGQIRK